MIDFKGISTNLGLFYVMKLRNSIHSFFILFFVVVLFFFFYLFLALSAIEYDYFSNWPFSLIQGSLTSITFPGNRTWDSWQWLRTLHPQLCRSEAWPCSSGHDLIRINRTFTMGICYFCISQLILLARSD